MRKVCGGSLDGVVIDLFVVISIHMVNMWGVEYKREGMAIESLKQFFVLHRFQFDSYKSLLSSIVGAHISFN